MDFRFMKLRQHQMEVFRRKMSNLLNFAADVDHIDALKTHPYPIKIMYWQKKLARITFALSYLIYKLFMSYLFSLHLSTILSRCLWVVYSTWCKQAFKNQDHSRSIRSVYDVLHNARPNIAKAKYIFPIFLFSLSSMCVYVCVRVFLFLPSTMVVVRWWCRSVSPLRASKEKEKDLQFFSPVFLSLSFSLLLFLFSDLFITRLSQRACTHDLNNHEIGRFAFVSNDAY